MVWRGAKENARHPHQEDRASTLQGVIGRNECIADPHQESEMHTVDTLGGRNLTSLFRASYFLRYSLASSLRFSLTPREAILLCCSWCHTERGSSATIVGVGVFHFCPPRSYSLLRRIPPSRTRHPDTAPWNATHPSGSGPLTDCGNAPPDDGATEDPLLVCRRSRPTPARETLLQSPTNPFLPPHRTAPVRLRPRPTPLRPRPPGTGRASRGSPRRYSRN